VVADAVQIEPVSASPNAGIPIIMGIYSTETLDSAAVWPDGVEISSEFNAPCWETLRIPMGIF